MGFGKSDKVDGALRLKYIRVLERFLKSIVAYLSKSEDLSYENFVKKVDNNLRYLQKTKTVDLYKGEFSDLEALVKEIISYRHNPEDIETIKSDILLKANRLEKSKNRKKYKKDKHKETKFQEW
jgi:regulator of sigma D